MRIRRVRRSDRHDSLSRLLQPMSNAQQTLSLPSAVSA